MKHNKLTLKKKVSKGIPAKTKHQLNTRCKHLISILSDIQNVCGLDPRTGHFEKRTKETSRLGEQGKSELRCADHRTAGVKFRFRAGMALRDISKLRRWASPTCMQQQRKPTFREEWKNRVNREHREKQSKQ